jgi:preprotein translocase subunit SecA
MEDTEIIVAEETPVTETHDLEYPEISLEMLQSRAARKAFGIRFKPYVRETPKIQRNDLCYCGSGKKYKHCHMELDKLEENAEYLH